MIIPNLAAAATITQLAPTGNATGNGTVLDLQGYKGAVTFVLATMQSTVGVGSIDAAPIQHSANNVAGEFTNVSGGAFTAVVNTANASNVGVQTKAFDVRALSRYVRVPLTISGTNANVPVAVLAVGQLERT
jgi:hypothetical protein